MTTDGAPGAAGRPGGGVDRRPQRIEAMFRAIASRYDLMNRLMTMGLDQRWRRAAAAAADPPPAQPVLDACCGTGDLVLALARRYPRSRVTGLDFSDEMLRLARDKASRADLAGAVEFVRGDLLELPFADDSFAAVTVAFGVRNVSDLPQAFGEMARVTRPGGRVVCLEITSPPGGLGRRFHELWFDRFVPELGRLVAKDGSAYSYLPESVRAFPPAEELSLVMRSVGLTSVHFVRFGFGIIAMHVAFAPGGGRAHGAVEEG